MHPNNRTWRVRGIPLEYDEGRLADALQNHADLQVPDDAASGDDHDKGRDIDVYVHTLAPDLRSRGQVATVRFASLPPPLEKLDRKGQLPLEIPNILEAPPAGAKQQRRKPQTAKITIDDHFLGVTVLYSPPPEDEHHIDVLAVSGLGSHPFGSFAHKREGNMWLSDSLPQDWPTARVMIYGYESGLERSTSFANLGDLASSLRIAIMRLRSESKRRLVLIGHSLGGLLIKEALSQIVESDSGSGALDFVSGILFFGVPNDGMNIESLIPMVNDQPNRFLLESLNAMNSQILALQRRNFSKILGRTDFDMFCFFETELSPTAAKVGGLA